jgi:hypothetical protein
MSDSHTDQVARARAQMANAPARKYFAYSTILDPAAFAEWKAQHGYSDFNLPAGKLARAIDTELVFDFPSRFWGGRVAGLQKRAGAEVFGRLFEVAGRDWPIIQHKEGAVTGMCVETTLSVALPDGSFVEATAFTTHPNRASTDGLVSDAFVEALVRGAKSAQLPPEYIHKLASLQGK